MISLTGTRAPTCRIEAIEASSAVPVAKRGGATPCLHGDDG